MSEKSAERTTVQNLKEEGRLKPFPEDLKARHEARLKTTITERNAERIGEDRGMVLGVGLALAELIRTFDQPTMAASIGRNFAYDLATYQRAGLEEYDIKELRKAIR